MITFPRITPLHTFSFGVVLAILIGIIYQTDDFWHMFGTHNHDHESSVVHYHADFVAVLNGEKIDLSDDQYMSDAEQLLTEDVHLHDNNDDIIHYHNSGITLGTFFSSIGLELNDSCLTLEDESFCADDSNVLRLYVNEEIVIDPYLYVAEDEDRILLYHGPDDQARIEAFQKEITDDACIYSLTCPEKGTPPPESCGLTCDL